MSNNSFYSSCELLPFAMRRALGFTLRKKRDFYSLDVKIINLAIELINMCLKLQNGAPESGNPEPPGVVSTLTPSPVAARVLYPHLAISFTNGGDHLDSGRWSPRF